jgi:hypothetical protein
MFDKVLTSSDVGKLNRLVIPKQHAEKYFPLDKAANEKGLMLSFEDRGGKLWRFRYSYWDSCQCYVMTKGWPGFVKEKRLNAGDIVSFSSDAADATRLFIDWKFSDWKQWAERVHNPTAAAKRVRLFGVDLDSPHPHGSERPQKRAADAAALESSAASSSLTEAHSSLSTDLDH